MWDIDTGMKIFEFCNAHDTYPITTITLDDTAKKLITGGQDGKIKLWNYNNGSCVRIMDKGTHSSLLLYTLQIQFSITGNSDEITSVIYATVNLNR